jgi:cytochrome c oxidase assembly protein subunit 15
VLLLAQVTLGIINVLAHLPLAIAVTHHGVAALLMLSLITLNHALRPRP